MALPPLGAISTKHSCEWFFSWPLVDVQNIPSATDSLTAAEYRRVQMFSTTRTRWRHHGRIFFAVFFAFVVRFILFLSVLRRRRWLHASLPFPSNCSFFPFSLPKPPLRGNVAPWRFFHPARKLIFLATMRFHGLKGFYFWGN